MKYHVFHPTATPTRHPHKPWIFSPQVANESGLQHQWGWPWRMACFWPRMTTTKLVEVRFFQWRRFYKTQKKRHATRGGIAVGMIFFSPRGIWITATGLPGLGYIAGAGCCLRVGPVIASNMSCQLAVKYRVRVLDAKDKDVWSNNQKRIQQTLFVWHTPLN